MLYQQQLNKVIDYIGKHLDDNMTLEQLSDIACFSKYHFHRLFTAHTGLSLRQYIRWLRLKRAAHQLIVDSDKSIIDIAIDAGFESHEAFTRAFKQTCGRNPSQFKAESTLEFWEKSPFSLPKRGDSTMNVSIKEIDARRLAVIEHRGDPKFLVDSMNKLINWAKSQTIDVQPKAGEAFGFAYDDPNTTPANEFRFDLAITIPQQLKVSGDIVEKQLPAGRYAIATHKGSRDHIGDTVYQLYQDWVPNSGEELADLPCIFIYHNFEHEVADTESLTDVCLLLK